MDARSGSGDAALLPFRSTLAELRPFDHGPSVATAMRASGLNDILDLAGNENAVGASPRVAAAIRAVADRAWHYPDSLCSDLSRLVAGDLRIDPARLLFGTGSEALLAVIARAVIAPAERVLISSPTFPVYASLARSLGAEIVDIPRHTDFRLNLEAIESALADPVRLLCLCNPNNPTGTPITPEELERLGRCLSPQSLLLVDEAYHEFADLERPLATLDALDRSGANYFVLRTFSKAFALGGLRVGYSIARTAALNAFLDRIRPQFGVSSLSQAAAMAAWRDRDHLQAAVAEIREARDRLRSELVSLGYEVARSAANFLLIEDGGQHLVESLLGRGIIVRHVPPGHVRLTVCRLRDVSRVTEAFRAAGRE